VHRCHPFTIRLKDRVAVLARFKAPARAPLQGAAAVNATRWALYAALANTGLPVEASSGGRTKHNRARLGIAKTHAPDAACVGEDRLLLTHRDSVCLKVAALCPAAVGSLAYVWAMSGRSSAGRFRQRK
jgi:hypothetical protein